MIRMIQSTSAKHAKDYFTDALLKSDYYLNDQELKGVFQGKLAERLGLSGYVSKDSFFALCDNRKPKSGEPLTPRTNAERTTGYDINFHAPKSLSIVQAFSKDKQLIDLFRDSVAATMQEIEADSLARVRKGKQYHDRETGELVFAEFLHQTARPVDNHPPDPHLHSHIYVFNVTWDRAEHEYKAGQFREIKRNMPYYQALFHKHLSDRLIKSGYQIRRTATSFEIVGVPQEVISLFAKRTDEIGRVAKEQGITNAKELAELGAKTRSKKQKGLSMLELKELWKLQVQAHGLDKGEYGSQLIRSDIVKDERYISKEACIDYALNHAFERASVTPLRRLTEAALTHSIGNSSIAPDAIKSALTNDDRLLTIKDKHQLVCTTKEVLQEEKRMIGLAKAGIGTIKPLYTIAPDLELKGQQAAAVNHVLTTPNLVSIVRGAAGTGKTHLMLEARRQIEAAGKQMFVVAPTANASRGVLRQEGFKDAHTVALFLIDKKRQEEIKGQVLWVDEAGLLGTKDMADLIAVAKANEAQLVLGGDTRQHTAVVRGDALRILNTVGGIKSAEVSKIYRQKNIDYKNAIQSLSEGKVLEGFARLDQIGAIKKAEPLKLNDELVKDYVTATKAGKECLVIAPTHKQGEAVTQEIRKALRKENLLGKREINGERLENLNLTVAQKEDWRNFTEGQRVQFNQNVKGIKRGSTWRVASAAKDDIKIEDSNGNRRQIEKVSGASFDIMEAIPIALSNGDKIRITRNAFDNADKKLNNGQILQVQSINKAGIIVLKNPVSKTTYTVNKDFAHLNHAHCITSYAAQGKTVDEVFISQPAGTFGATDAKQLYVSASRGKDKATFYTDDKVGLLEHASRLGDRQSAHELLSLRHTDYVAQLDRQKEEFSKDLEPDKQKDDYLFHEIDKDEPDYEPRF